MLGGRLETAHPEPGLTEMPIPEHSLQLHLPRRAWQAAIAAMLPPGEHLGRKGDASAPTDAGRRMSLHAGASGGGCVEAPARPPLTVTAAWRSRTT